jgi:hypothetical protein
MNTNYPQIDLTVFQDLLATATEVANVWQLRVPSMPWKIEKALHERESLVAKLETSFPYRAIWLSDWASGEQQGWRILTGDEQLSALDDDLKNGAWALFFFEDPPVGEKLGELVPSEPPNATVAIQSVRKLGARAGIWSWYDNYEWFVVLPRAI